VPKYLLNSDGSLGEKNDICSVSVEHKLGIRGSPTCALSFGDNGGAVGFLVGQLNQGLRCMFTMMNHARMDVGLQAVGLSERAYQHAVGYAKGRVQGGSEIIHHADVKRMLMQMRALTEASRALCYTTFAQADISHKSDAPIVSAAAKARTDLLTPLAKAWSTELVNEVCSLAIQVHGGMGYIEETGVAQYYRDARILAIYEGSNGIQAWDFVGRKLIRDNGQMMSSLVADIRSTILAMAGGCSKLVAMAALLSEALDNMQSAVAIALDPQVDVSHKQAVSFDLMMLAGYVTAAWLLLQKAHAAIEHSAGYLADKAYYQNVQRTAHFYMSHILPRAHAHYLSICAADTTLTTLAAEQF
jgi:alkylation response protein AidB-like acyl-CoA dehydrogenase